MTSNKHYADLYQRAVEIATQAHQGQTRWGGEPYITHPLAVAEAFDLARQPREKIVAVLHDVLEDSDVTYQEMIGHFGITIADALQLLTHDSSVTYADYIANIRDEALASVEAYRVRRESRMVDTASAGIAKAVKMADLRHNLSDLTHPKKHVQRRDKYQLALKLLGC